MFYTTEEAAIVCGFLDLYLNRDSVDRAVREQNRKFQRSAAMLKESQQCFSPMQSMTKRHITKTPKLAYKVSLGAFAIT